MKHRVFDEEFKKMAVELSRLRITLECFTVFKVF